MGKKKDIKEKRYGKLVAIEPTKKKVNKIVLYGFLNVIAENM